MPDGKRANTVDRVICAKRPLGCWKFRLRCSPDNFMVGRRCRRNLNKASSSPLVHARSRESVNFWGRVKQLATVKRVPLCNSASIHACFGVRNPGENDKRNRFGSTLSAVRRLASTCGKMMFLRHRHPPSQNGIVDATNIGKVRPARHRTRRCKNPDQEGGWNEGGDCSARPPRTTNRRATSAGMRQRRNCQPAEDGAAHREGAFQPVIPALWNYRRH